MEERSTGIVVAKPKRGKREEGGREGGGEWEERMWRYRSVGVSVGMDVCFLHLNEV